MRQVMFRLTDDEFNRSEYIAKYNGYDSVNQFAKYQVLNLDAELANVEVKNEKAKQIRTYLYPHEIEMLERNAKLHGMSLSREIAIRLRQSCLKDEVCLYPYEVNELSKLTTAVNRIGRNIHFIIKGERYCTVNDPDFRKEVIEVIKLCQEIKSNIESLIDSAPNRFG